MRTRVLLAEAVDIVRDTLVSILELEADLAVVAVLASGDRVVPEAVARRPDVAVLGIDLPGVDGLTAAAALRRRLPGCRVLILTGLAVPAAGAGAPEGSVFLVRDAPAEDFIDAVRGAARGLTSRR